MEGIIRNSSSVSKLVRDQWEELQFVGYFYEEICKTDCNAFSNPLKCLVSLSDQGFLSNFILAIRVVVVGSFTGPTPSR